MTFLLLLVLMLVIAAIGAIDFAARRFMHAIFEAWAALFLLFALLTFGTTTRSVSVGREADRRSWEEVVHSHSARFFSDRINKINKMDSEHSVHSVETALKEIRAGHLNRAHGFVFLWHGGPPKVIPPGAKCTPRDGMNVVICAWVKGNQVLQMTHHSLN